MTGRRFALLAGFALVCVLAFTVVRPADSDAETAVGDGIAAPVEQVFSGELQLDAPTVVDAGATPDISISSSAPDGTVVELYVVGALDTQRVVGRLRNGNAGMRIPAQATEHAGELLLIARVGDATSTAEMRAVASTAVDPVVPLVGPRTIIADDQDMTMVVLIPADRFGNPLADGTDATMSLVRPGAGEEQVTVATEGGVAAALINADTVAGRVAVSAEVDGAGGPAHSFEQVAGRPGEFALVTPDNPEAVDLTADGFSLHLVETGELRDVFDNVLPDGVAVEFVVDSAEGRSLLAATVQAGRSRTLIEAPANPGAITLTARVSGRESSPLALTFEPAVDSGSASIVDESVLVGPMVTLRGGYVADGTNVTVTDRATGAVVATGALLAGETTIPLPLGAPTDDLFVTVLGIEIPVVGSP